MKTRIEADSIGSLEVPSDAYYGVQSLRAKRNFPITGTPIHPVMIQNLAKIKKAAAISNREAQRLPEEKAAAAAPKENTAVYGFEDAESLMRVCKFLERRGYAFKSVAFVEETAQKKHRYYLLICEPSPVMTGKKAKYLRENLFIGEFGTRIEHKSAVAYLKEHCRCLCETDAVHTLAALAR